MDTAEVVTSTCWMVASNCPPTLIVAAPITSKSASPVVILVFSTMAITAARAAASIEPSVKELIWVFCTVSLSLITPTVSTALRENSFAVTETSFDESWARSEATTSIEPAKEILESCPKSSSSSVTPSFSALSETSMSSEDDIDRAWSPAVTEKPLVCTLNDSSAWKLTLRAATLMSSATSRSTVSLMPTLSCADSMFKRSATKMSASEVNILA